MANWGHYKRKAAAALFASFLTTQALPAFSQGGEQTSPQVIELNNEGVRALNASNFALSIQKFEAALKLDPNYGRAKANLAIAYNNYGLQLSKNPQEALKLFHKALDLDPSNQTTRQNVDGIIRMMNRDPRSFQDRVELGDLARKGGDFTGAVVEYQAAVGIKDDAGVREKLGDVYRVQDKLDRAIKEYQNAARIKDSAGLEVKLGQAFQAKDDVPNAITALGTALKMNSSDPDVLEALVTAWDQAVKKNPTSPENHIGLGQALMYRGDYDQAKEELLQGIRFSPGKQNATAQQLLAKIPDMRKRAEVDRHINNGVEFHKNGKYVQAIEEYKAALALDPNNDAIWVNIGSAFQQMKDYQNAIQAYQQAKKFNAKNADADVGLKTAGDALQEQQIDALAKSGNDLFKAGKFKEAIAAYNGLLKFNPNDAGAHFNIGAAYQALKDLDTAISEYRIAMNQDPKNKEYAQAYEDAMDDKAQPMIDKGIAAQKEKKYAEAVELYTQALVVRPKNDEVWFNLGAAQYSREDYGNSEKSFQKAFDLDPKSRVDSLYFIGTIDENKGNGPEALTDYTTYLQKAPTGTYATQAKERVAALRKNIADTQKIKSESDIAKEKDAFEAYKQALEAQKNKQFDQAIALYNKAIAALPMNADFIYALGTCYFAMEKYDDAIAQYQKAKGLVKDTKIFDDAIKAANQDKAQPLVDQAVQKQQAGDFAGSIPLFVQALQLIPENAVVWSALGGAYQNTDQFQQARDAYDKAYKIDAKGQVDNLYLMGAIDENYGKGAIAKSMYDLYLKNAPAGKYRDLAQARTAALAKNIQDTEKLATTADVAAAKTAEEAYKKGLDLQQNKKYDEAIAAYQTAVQAMPNEAAYPFAIATAYQAKEDWDNARTWYQKALPLSKNKDLTKQINEYMAGMTEMKAAPLLEAANKAYTEGDFAKAAENYQEVLKITPNNADAYTFLAASYQNLGNYSQARSAYEQGFKIGGKAKADNLYFLGVLDENDGNAAAAMAHYTQYIQTAPQGGFRAGADDRIKALRANPKDLQKLQTATQQKAAAEVQQAYADAVAAQTAGKYDDALALYAKAIAGAPSDPTFVYGRGTCYQARNDATKNDLDSALADYEKAASLNPKEKAYQDAAAGIRSLKAAPLLESAYKKLTTNDESGKPDIAGAIADYRAALKLNDDANTHFSLGAALQQANDLNGALQEYTAAINKNNTLADAYYFRGILYESMNQKEPAKKDYQKYVQLQPAGQYAADAKERIKLLSPAAPGKKK